MKVISISCRRRLIRDRTFHAANIKTILLSLLLTALAHHSPTLAPYDFFRHGESRLLWYMVCLLGKTVSANQLSLNNLHTCQLIWAERCLICPLVNRSRIPTRLNTSSTAAKDSLQNIGEIMCFLSWLMRKDGKTIYITAFLQYEGIEGPLQ